MSVNTRWWRHSTVPSLCVVVARCVVRFLPAIYVDHSLPVPVNINSIVVFMKDIKFVERLAPWALIVAGCERVAWPSTLARSNFRLLNYKKSSIATRRAAATKFCGYCGYCSVNLLVMFSLDSIAQLSSVHSRFFPYITPRNDVIVRGIPAHLRGCDDAKNTIHDCLKNIRAKLLSVFD